ncbi:hypothetical protein FZI85_02835 [Mycobacterium sp. CBMA293]|uniref:hypothetical protein n=1 Tax=unclassified Mycolicibacterium TaxID=2636767 RepID=UPI0012DC72CC|nr:MULTISPECIES: hypothetical protein [unclassified Mycolicibacterium]MUL48066.1 hypothetical protein [Mycolicibacterium sp. CBMA 360]MUL58244.1 hypothetical protein [Mycolicibacterium sp. CBMA 335]MUL73702.1 hypothetical protein [Mycolicibacterium sp. CBMA 311]MUL93127.1 hypothetical protein [Mycolicibacterium sp. CBMA 230]MUM09970.1 hypothetical protein [Mycolicibacterium sp. CBMA 293]
MTALQDWLNFRPVEDGIKDMMFRPLRAVLSVVEDFDDAVDVALERLAAHANGHQQYPEPEPTQAYIPDNVVLMRPGLERC